MNICVMGATPFGKTLRLQWRRGNEMFGLSAEETEC